MFHIGDLVTRRGRPATFFGYIGTKRAFIRYNDFPNEYRTVRVETLQPVL